ncbi:MFS transporter [Halovulum sp. GXIMD14793]
MTETATPQAVRNVTILVIAQAVLGAQMPISFTLGGLSGEYLASNPCFATLPISLIVLGSMLTAPVISNVMQKHGRQLGFFIGAIGGAIGAGLSAAGLYWDSFTLFLIGSLFTGIYMSAHGFYRFAATDTAGEAFRAKAISYVMAGGLAAALIGPQLVKATDGMTDPIPFAGGYLAAMMLNLVGALVFFLLDIPKPKPPAADAPKGRSYAQLLKDPQIVVAMICAMVSYALMNLVMTSTPLAVVGCGYSTDNAADIVSAHVIAMFFPSFFTGHLIARFGVEKIIAIGLFILVGAGLVALSGVQLEQFFIALVLLGIGWNFGFIGGTAMLATAHAPEERGRVQGMNDFFVFGMVTIASLSSGFLMNCSGGSAQTGWSAVNYAMVPFLALAAGALGWYVVRHKRSPA